MKIVKFTDKAYKVYKDVQYGEVFHFQDENTIFMMGYDTLNTTDYLINLATGRVIVSEKRDDEKVEIFKDAMIILNPDKTEEK